MVPHLHSGIFLVFVLILLTAGCTQPALMDPVVTVGEISLSDVSLQAMTVNTTITIFNPNHVGADLEERDLLFTRFSDLVTVRSDVFTAYLLVRIGEAGPQKRLIAIFDRSRVRSPGDR